MGHAAFETKFCQMLMAVREVPDSNVRWQAEHGNRKPLDQQQLNVKLLLTAVYRYDVKSAPKEHREKIEEQVDQIKAKALAYQASLRKSKAVSSDDHISRLCLAYSEVLCAGQQFCAAVFPHLIPAYNKMLGITA